MSNRAEFLRGHIDLISKILPTVASTNLRFQNVIGMALPFRMWTVNIVKVRETQVSNLPVSYVVDVVGNASVVMEAIVSDASVVLGTTMFPRST